MLRRTVAVVAMIVGAGGVIVAGRPSLEEARAQHLHSVSTVHPSDPQIFTLDNQVCDQASPLTGEEDPESAWPALNCNDAYDRVPGASRMQHVDTVLQEGNRVPVSAVVWIGKAFGSAGDASIIDGSVVGEAYAKVNIECDTTPDYLIDGSSTLPIQYLFEAVPVDVREQTTAWGPTTGFDGRDERLLDELVPPGWTRHTRYRAEFDFVAIGGSTSLQLVDPISLNAIEATPPWGDMRATILLFGADAVAPSAQLELCFDTPQVSRWALGAGALLTYPVSPGLYPMWTSFVSAPGTRDEQRQDVAYVTSCKHVGGLQQDADNDCMPDAIDGDDMTYDRDSDGLIDGVDVAWAGSGPCPSGGLPPDVTADCDGDGRQDAEEHFAGTNPRVADTDGDGFVDSGLNFDCDGDGQAEDAFRVSANPHHGANRVRIPVRYCKPNGLNTMQGGLGGRPWGNVRPADPPTSVDNCPLNAGPEQVNSSTTDPDLDSAPLPGDANGRFVGTADATHPNARFAGDICSPDNDNDGVLDLVEGTLSFDMNATDDTFCNTSGVGVPAATLGNVRDTDADGSLDGVECQLGRNPADPTSKPAATMQQQQQVFFRLMQLTQPGYQMPLIMSLDDGSTIMGVPEARGLGAAGASRLDQDRDGCVDEVESIDVDGSRVAGDPDRLGIARAALGVSTFAPPGSLTAEERRTADVDYNGALGDPDRLAAARIVLTASLPAVPDYNLTCTEAVLGYPAN